MWTQPSPFVRKNRSLVLFHEISFTSNWNCFSIFILVVLVSIKVTRSSLFPTAIVFPSGAHVILMFSPVNEKRIKTWSLEWKIFCYVWCTLGINYCTTLLCPCIPNPGSFISTGCRKQVWVCSMPTQLIDTTIMSSEGSFLCLKWTTKNMDAD